MTDTVSPGWLTRRNLLVLLAALAATPTLAACGSDPEGERSGSGMDLVSVDVARAEPDPTAIAAAVAGMHGLGAALWAQSDTGSNLSLSPFSIAVALAMTANGAVGQTRNQMLAALEADDLEGLNAGLNALTQSIEALAGETSTGQQIALDSANQLFAQRDYEFLEPFLTSLAANYGAGVELVDYLGATEQARAAINSWTAVRTHDRIPEIVPEGGVTPDTRLSLVNALYFKAPWLEEFPDPTDGDFTLASGETVQVPRMVAMPKTAGYAEGSIDGSSWQAAQLPYADNTLAMTLVKSAQDPVARLPQILSAIEVGSVHLTMPTWTFRSDTGLTDPLKAIGMTAPFADADFSAMTGTRDLVITDVFHQVFIAADQHGTEAAAATAVVVGETSAPMLLGEVVLDEPFWFVIHDLAFGAPLFIGRVADPR
ncbi:MAG: serpin family protein [Nocardioides sp.]